MDLLLPFLVPIEFVKGFFFSHRGREHVTVFGSARFGSDHAHYDVGMQTGRAIYEAGASILTGGGPGLMEAANRGFLDARNGDKRYSRNAQPRRESLGINILIHTEQRANDYLDRFFVARYFFVRKYFLFHYGKAFVFLPGGFGTLDELSEVLTLMRTRKIQERPIILVGTKFWSGFVDWIRVALEDGGAVVPPHTPQWLVTDSFEEVRARLAAIMNETAKSRALPQATLGKS